MPNDTMSDIQPAFSVLQTGLSNANASLAEGDLAGALSICASLRSEFPDRVEPFLLAASALMERWRTEEADSLLEVAAERFPANVAVAVTFAKVATDRGELTEAKTRWERAAALAPSDAAPRIGLARLAQAFGDMAGALTRWRSLQRDFPSVSDGWMGEAELLRASEQFEEADAVLATAMARFPGDADLCIATARVAAARRDWAEAAKRWDAVRSQFPDRSEGLAGQVALWRDMGQFDAADSMLTEALRLHPDDAELLILSASVAQSRGMLSDAISRWEYARERLPSHPAVFLGGIAALQAAGRLRDAELLATEARRRFPAQPGPVVALASIAEAQGHADLAKTRLDEARALFPWYFQPIAAPLVIRRADVVRVLVVGFELAHQIAQLLERVDPARDRIDVRWINAAMDIDTMRSRLPEQWLDDVSVHFDEFMAGGSASKAALRDMLPAACKTRAFPTSTWRCFWPFLGSDERLVPEPPFFNGGRYPDPDRIAAVLANPAITDDVLFDQYMALTEAEPLDLDALLAADLARLRADDRDVVLAPFVEAHFRDVSLFAAPTERCAPLVKEIARQLLSIPVLAEIDGLETRLDRLTLGWRSHRRALPVHPRVARHFGLTWWSPDRLYRLGQSEFDFREYTIRMLRWSPWLA